MSSAQARQRELSFLVDSNVWLDAFIDRSVMHEDANGFLKRAYESGTALYTAIETTKDVYYLLSCELKRMQRAECGTVTEPFANAVNEAAWSCLSVMRRISTVVAADAHDMIEATVMRSDHEDYEDNLIIAAAQRAQVSHIVSSDKALQKHSPIPCIGIREALEIMGTEPHRPAPR